MDQMIVITKMNFPRKPESDKGQISERTKLPLSEVLKATVGQSDNIGCDVLLKLIGGPEKVTGYIRSLGIKDTAIAVTERQMHEKWDTRYQNWTTPQASSLLLKNSTLKKSFPERASRFCCLFCQTQKPEQNVFLPNLPAGTPLAHKTGISRHKRHHRRVNDIGIVTLPDGRHYAISVFVADSREHGNERKNHR